MFAIFNKSTGVEVCGGPDLRSPKMAWDHFKEECWPALQVRPDGTRLDWSAGEHRTLFECKMVGERLPLLRVSGHSRETERLIIDNQTVHFAGRCSCGWQEVRLSRAEAKRAHRTHLESLSGTDRTPRPAEHLPAALRVSKSLEKFKAEGGDRKTFRLSKPALEELDRMVTQEIYPNHTAALEAVLFRQRPAAAPATPSLYARHVDDDDVQTVINDAVRLACRELDVLFPGAAPDGGKGVSSNFQGLLTEHVKAMLAGSNQARLTHHTHLPALLANDRVFGRPFALPEDAGAGYVVVRPTTNQVLSAYSGRFLPVFRDRSQLRGQPHMEPLFGEVHDGGTAPDTDLRADPGRELHFYNDDVDILFSSHEAAMHAALKALHKEGASPASQPLSIIAAAPDEEKACFVVI